jgi:hypothetical protein
VHMHVDNDPMLPGITAPLSIALPVKRKHERAPVVRIRPSWRADEAPAVKASTITSLPG